MFHPAILNEDQKRILKELAFLAEREFYLAGGTALSLHLGHRTSTDFDFYSPKAFDATELFKKLQKALPEIKILQSEKGTARAIVTKTEVSFFEYDYQLLEQLVPFEEIELASVQDIAAMKLAAIVQRGTQRDFIDVFYLLKEHSIEELISFALAKFPGYQEMLILRALIYFNDAEDSEDARGIKVLDNDFSWPSVKKAIQDEVKKYQLQGKSRE